MRGFLVFAIVFGKKTASPEHFVITSQRFIRRHPAKSIKVVNVDFFQWPRVKGERPWASTAGLGNGIFNLLKYM